MPTTPASKRGIRKRGIVKTKAAHVYARHPDDWYVEEPWVAERLLDVESFSGAVWDPACGEGRIVRALRARGHDAVGSDIKQRNGFKSLQLDFMRSDPGTLIAYAANFPNLFFNPPFRQSQEFVKQAIQVAERKTVAILPTEFLHGDERSRWLELTPLLRVYFLTPRPSMPPGDSKEAKNPSGGRTSFSVFVWLRGFDGEPTVRWLRKEP